MQLPDPDDAAVERDKILSYLLNAGHPDNGGKARFFEGLGFQHDRWETLAAAFRNLAHEATVTQSLESPHGQKYVIVGKIESPSGRVAMVQTVWIVERGADMPRLVTAYPYEE
jgi:hypothetical protein